MEHPAEAEEAQRRHAEFFLELVETAEPKLIGGPSQAEWLERLEEEHDNLRAAIRWALSVGDAETAARGSAMWLFWWYRGYHREGRRWMEAALQQDLSPPSRTKVLGVAGSLAYAHGDYENCRNKDGVPMKRSPLASSACETAPRLWSPVAASPRQPRLGWST